MSSGEDVQIKMKTVNFTTTSFMNVKCKTSKMNERKINKLNK